MKKTPARIIIFWIGVAAAAVGWLTLALLLSFSPVIAWIPFAVLLLGLAAWIGIHFVVGGSPKPKKGAAFAGNQAVFRRIERETGEAVARYLDTVKRRGITKHSALYERPWFLLMGSRGSGKTSLLKGSGLSFPMRYPSEQDGLMVEGASQVCWYFADGAVWIDVPGSYSEETGKDDWQALIASLTKIRGERPVDGMAVVVDADAVLKADEHAVKNCACTLRGRIDEMIAFMGIEFPVYLIFNQADKIPGFNEYFGDPALRGQDQIFGATISHAQRQLLPQTVFADEFNLLVKSLAEVRLDKLANEPEVNRKRLICRFVIHFEGIQEKLGQLVTELFKPTNYVGKPIFRGFYFTCAYEIAPKRRGAVQPPSAGVVSATIANHPLNPKRIVAAPRPSSGGLVESGRASELASTFVMPLFREIMVHDTSLVAATQSRSRASLLRHYLFTGTIVLAATILVLLLVVSRNRSAAFMNTAAAEMKVLETKPRTPVECYASLEILSHTIAKLQRYQHRGSFVDLGFGFYRGDALLVELKKYYFGSLKKFIVAPAVNYLEYRIREGASTYGELGGNQYDSLYRDVKTYLSISEAMTERFVEIDSSYLRPVLQDAITRSLLANLQTARLPASLESIVIDNIGGYLFYLKRREFPLIQENQELVADARSKLRRLPDAKNLYATVVNRLGAQAPSLTFDQVLGRTGEGILKSAATISTLYTQDGWDQLVKDALAGASKDPYKIDWVIGITKDQVPGQLLDSRQLHDDMVNAYLDDFKSQWLAFLTSVKIEPFGDLGRSSRMLQKLVADKGEIRTLLETVATYTVLKQDAGGEALAGKVLGMASKSKEAKQVNALSKTSGIALPSFSLGVRSPFDALNDTFDPLRSFVRSTGGSLSGLEGYRDKVLSLTGQLSAIETQGNDYAQTVFNGTEKDPLLSGWKYTTGVLESMPADLAGSLQGVLLAPYEHTGKAAADVLTETLNRRWQNEIVKPFTVRFSGKYPFGHGDDATFGEVMDFFRPATGTYWGFYDRVLAPYVVKAASGWSVRTVGSVRLNFNPKLQESLIAGERLRDMFFKPDGELQPIVVTIWPASSNKNDARIEIDGQVLEFSPGGRSQEARWPSGTPGGGAAALKIAVSKDFSQDLSFGGAWGFLKLIQAGKVNSTNRNTLTVTWQASVQNMYMVVQQYRIQSAGVDHPFVDPVFASFHCPTELLLKESPAPPAPTGL